MRKVRSKRLQNFNEKMIALNNKYLDYINSNRTVEIQILLTINESKLIQSGYSWESYNFGHIPLAATYPMLAKIKGDAERYLLSILLYLTDVTQKDKA